MIQFAVKKLNCLSECSSTRHLQRPKHTQRILFITYIDTQPIAFTCFINSNLQLIAIVHTVTSHAGHVVQVQLNIEGPSAAKPKSSAPYSVTVVGYDHINHVVEFIIIIIIIEFFYSGLSMRATSASSKHCTRIPAAASRQPQDTQTSLR